MITAASNSRIKRLVQLNQKSKLRRTEDVFLAEGVKMFLEAPREQLQEVYVSESFLEKCSCREHMEEVGYEVVSDSVFSKISDTCTPQGVLCVLKQFHYNIEEMLRDKAPLFLLLENIQDPGNLGTMLRTGEGAGVSGIIMSREGYPFDDGQHLPRSVLLCGRFCGGGSSGTAGGCQRIRGASAREKFLCLSGLHKGDGISDR